MNKELHLLSRATFGPTLPALNEITAGGREKWLMRQLRPSHIDNGIAEGKLLRYFSLGKNPTQLMNEYPRPEPGEIPVPGREFWRPFSETAAGALILARYSECQLLEVMTHFWFNHFNVFGPEGLSFYTMPPYFLKTIRGNALGRFPKLLEDTARSPAMLYYLDNYLSTRAIQLPGGEERGLNENYARELLELHTVSPAAGYTQEDVIQAAKILTGWSITRPRDGTLEFKFYNNLHERGLKKVLGKQFKGNSQNEGLELLRHLANHPYTAVSIAQKLTSFFVSDTPPESLVTRVADVYLQTEGDIPSMLREIFLSQEFSRPSVFRTKTKSPMRYLISALRALNADITEGELLNRELNSLGQPLFQCRPPTGYSHLAEDVMQTGIFLSAGTKSRALAFDALRGARMDGYALNPDHLQGKELADLLLETILFSMKKATRDIVRDTAGQGHLQLRDLISLILVTPDFIGF